MYYTIPELLYLFFVYAFIGWSCEVAFAAAVHGKYSNRGFLIGPICPIYGYGVLIVLLVLTPISKHLFLLFLGAMLLTSLLEYVTGWYLEKRYNERWWDYSDNKFNLKGYICLEFSVIWGLACVVVLRLVNPPILWVIDKILSFKYGIIPGLILLAIYIIDMIISDKRVREFAKRVKAIEVMDESIRHVSDSMAHGIYENVTETKEKITEIKEKPEVAEKLKEFDEKHREFDKRKEKIDLEIEKRKSELETSLAEHKEERENDRQQRRMDLEAEIERYKQMREEENERRKAELAVEIEYRRKHRQEYLDESSKSFGRVISKFPGIEKGRHEEVFKNK